MEYIKIENTLSSNTYEGFKITHQRQLPKRGTVNSLFDYSMTEEGLIKNELSIYVVYTKKQSKTYILEK